MDFTTAQDSLRSFARERDWEQFHTPRNLLLALTGEVGELAAEMQWKSDDDLMISVRSPELDARLSEEIADVAIYLLRLADVLEIDLDAAISAKIALNAEKYPADEVQGSAAKYTERGETDGAPSGQSNASAFRSIPCPRARLTWPMSQRRSPESSRPRAGRLTLRGCTRPERLTSAPEELWLCTERNLCWCSSIANACPGIGLQIDCSPLLA